MWCNENHQKVTSYFVDKDHRHISLHWNLKKWIQKFSLKQNTLNQIKQFTKDIKSNLESCSPSSITITNKQTFLNQQTNELSPNQQIQFQFEPPKQIDLIGSFLFYGLCYNPNYIHTNHYNIDISVTIPSKCIQLKDLTNATNKHYLLKRRVYLHYLYKHLQQQTIPMISNSNEKCKIFIDYLNHDKCKPIIIIQPIKHCSVRIIPCLDIQQFITNDNDIKSEDSDIENESDYDSDDDEELDENMIMNRIFFGNNYKKFRILQEQYTTDLNTWDHKKLQEAIHENMSKSEIFEQYLYAQQIMEDMIMKSVFMEFYNACKINPNLHRALVLIKAWWNNTNFHANENNKNMTDSTRFGDINSFHLTMLLLLFFRTYHIDKWDSPLIVMGKFLELISREELGTLLCQSPPASLFEKNPSWVSTTFGDSHLFTSLNSSVENSKDRASVFNPKKIDYSEKNSSANANIYNANSEDIMYSYNIWKTKKKGISMCFPTDSDDVLFDEWIGSDSENEKEKYLKLLCNEMFPVVFTNVSGRINYTFRVNRSNYLYFIREARKASISLNELLMEIPWMPNPEYWSYKSLIHPGEYDIVTAQVMTYHQKCIQQLLIPTNLQFFMYFDGYIKLKNVSFSLYELNNLEDILINALSDRCRSFVMKLDENSNNVFIGLSMHTFAYRSMILGPPNNQKAAIKQFKQFWGDNIVELKRFPDGTLLHSVILTKQSKFGNYLQIIDEIAANSHINKQKKRHIEIKNSWKKNKNKNNFKIKRPASFVIKIILYHTLNKHLNLDINNISLILDPYWSIIPLSLAHTSQIGQKTSQLSLNKAYNRLKGLLKSICHNKNKTGIPLRLSEIYSISKYLWNTSSNGIPKQKNMLYNSYSLVDNIEPIEIIIKFQYSGYWPKKNAKAVNNLKIAFYIQLHEAFKKYKIKSLLSTKYIDVIVNGFNFRVFIISDTEFTIHKNPILVRQTKYKYKFLPKLGKILLGISRNYAYFTPTICIIKQWFSNNLFSDLISEHIIDVLVADLFINCEPYQCPQSSFIGLIRFLYLLINYKWLQQPYIINLGVNNQTEMSNLPISYQYNIFKTKMLNERMNDNGLHTMYIIVPGLEETSYWTKNKPTLQTLNRLINVAKCSLNYLNKLFYTMSNDDEYLRILKPAKSEFDFVINLNSDLIPNYMSNNIWKNENGMNKWRERQIIKRMSRITNMKNNKKENSNGMDNAVKMNEINNEKNKIMPFIANPIWEAKKRKFEMDYEMKQEPLKKKRKIVKSKLHEEIERNPEKFLEENELTVIGLNPIKLFLKELNKFTNETIEVYYNGNGGDFIGCKWLITANEQTQKTIYSAIWELGKDIIRSIKVKKCPTQNDINNKNELNAMLNVMHMNVEQSQQNNNNNSNDNDNGGWITV